MKKLGLFMVTALIVLGMCGCSENDKAADLQGLAKLEVYGADETLLNTIEDEETLIKFNELCSQEDTSASEAEQEALAGEAEEHRLLYTIVAYKKPVAKYGNKELKKNITLEIYEDTDVVKMVPALDSMENLSIEEEMDFSWYERVSPENIQVFLR